MLKFFASLFLAFFLGWFLHLLYSTLKMNDSSDSKTPAFGQRDCSNEENYFHETIEKVIIQKVIEYVPQTKIVYRTKKVEKKDENSSKELFFVYLEKKEFDTAMVYYEEADEEKHASYQTALFGYFNSQESKNPIKTIEEMQSFIEIEPESKLITFQLAKLFEKREEYPEALNIIVDFSYLVSYNQRNSINTKITSISKAYITKLSAANNFVDLIDFLISRINVGILSEFYSFELAKAYLQLKKYLESIDILQQLQYNSIYKERVLEMLTYIEQKQEEMQEYPIQIPLIRSGMHFLVKAYVDNVETTLLVDTGASITSIDYAKVQHAKVFKEKALFHTAGGNVYDTIYSVDNFQIGDVSLKNFSISGSGYSGKSQDGLLGMNFLGKFKFKIDQKAAILFLGKKESYLVD